MYELLGYLVILTPGVAILVMSRMGCKDITKASQGYGSTYDSGTPQDQLW